MNLYTTDGALLYASPEEDSFQETIEHAIEDGVVLDNVNLKNKDLRNINFDNVIMRNACLKGADLTGANISEAILDHSDFTEAHLYNTCFAYTSLIGCIFINSEFGATDFSRSNINYSIFSGPSAFLIEFRQTLSMDFVTYLNEQIHCAMTTPPILIRSNLGDVMILDQHIMVENEMFLRSEIEDINTILPDFRNCTLLFNNIINNQEKNVTD